MQSDGEIWNKLNGFIPSSLFQLNMDTLWICGSHSCTAEIQFYWHVTSCHWRNISRIFENRIAFINNNNNNNNNIISSSSSIKHEYTDTTFIKTFTLTYTLVTISAQPGYTGVQLRYVFVIVVHFKKSKR